MLEVRGRLAILKEGTATGVSLAVEGDRIVDIGSTRSMRRRHAFSDSIGSQDSLVMPAFVDAHTHSSQIAMRGSGSGRSLLEWLSGHIWAWEGRMGREQAGACARIAQLEMIRSGVASFLDYTSLRHTDEAFKAARTMGLRALIGKTMMDRASPAELLEETDHALKESRRLIGKWHGKEGGRLGCCMAPRFSRTSTDELLIGCRELSERHGIISTTHCAENLDEVRDDRRMDGRSAIRRLASLGLLGRRTLLVHGVWFGSRDISLLARSGTALAHCPGSNMMLASGTAPIPAMLRAGVRLSLGSDMGAYPSMSMFDQMRLGSLMQKLVLREPRALPAHEAFRMATSGGAEALGLGSGVLEKGAKADIALLDLRDMSMVPLNDPIAQIVYGAGPRSVRSLICVGRILMREGKVEVVDEERVLARASESLGRSRR